ncbi:hypothetical protein F5Y12DRAFT_255746 [Xylaria sp. FL1777]|nr:hypothetical protein F5Y12DRAFT_255746 [Xylaria sp. FL1777]
MKIASMRSRYGNPTIVFCLITAPVQAFNCFLHIEVVTNNDQNKTVAPKTSYPFCCPNEFRPYPRWITESVSGGSSGGSRGVLLEEDRTIGISQRRERHGTYLSFRGKKSAKRWSTKPDTAEPRYSPIAVTSISASSAPSTGSATTGESTRKKRSLDSS